MAFFTPPNFTLLPCSPMTVQDRTRFEEIHNVTYKQPSFYQEEIYVLYNDETWKFQSWNTGPNSTQLNLTPLQGSTTELNSHGCKSPVINTCRFFRKIPLGILFYSCYLFIL